jgi:hypothetical protein
LDLVVGACGLIDPGLVEAREGRSVFEVFLPPLIWGHTIKREDAAT